MEYSASRTDSIERWIEWEEAAEIEHEMLNRGEPGQQPLAFTWSRFLQAHPQSLHYWSIARLEISSLSRAAIASDYQKGGAHGFAEIVTAHSDRQSPAAFGYEEKSQSSHASNVVVSIAVAPTTVKPQTPIPKTPLRPKKCNRLKQNRMEANQ